MELQRVLAEDTRRAMEKVIHLYGEDALVVSNKRAKDQTEIIVAIDLAPETQKTLNEMQAPALQEPRVSLGEMPNFSDVMETEVFKTVPAIAHDPVQNKSLDLDADLDSGLIEEFMHELKETVVKEGLATEGLATEGLASDEFNPANEDRESLKAREIVDMVRQELAAMRNEFKMSQQLEAWSGTQSVTDEMRPLIEAFNETGMPVGLRALVTDVVNQHTDMTAALSDIADMLGAAIKHTNVLENIQGIHLIAGSSGAGKTLMAGRLAKHAALNYGDQDVAIISYNDIRFGAWSQTQLIGSQAGVETFRAGSLEMLESLLQELESRKLIIIDMPGVDVLNHMNALTQLLPNARKHLVLAADASESSVKRHLKSAEMSWDSVMLSRLEPDVYPWAVINTLLNAETPVSLGAAEPSIIDMAPLTGHGLAQQALSHLPISFV
jgi:flagellar biosynthesis GTPase FlhF